MPPTQATYETRDAHRVVRNALARKGSGHNRRGDARLTAAQARFALLLVAGLPGWQAYQKAFATNASRRNLSARASTLLQREDVKKAIEQREAAICR